MRLKNPKETPTKKSTKKELFSRGFGSVQSKLLKKNRFVMSCYNCAYFYQAVGDSEELCQNPDVLRYDMTITENNISCTKWEPCLRSQSVKSLFKKGGKNNGK